MSERKIDRRLFLRASAITGTGVLLAACAPKPPETPEQYKYETEERLGRVLQAEYAFTDGLVEQIEEKVCHELLPWRRKLLGLSYRLDKDENFDSLKAIGELHRFQWEIVGGEIETVLRNQIKRIHRNIPINCDRPETATIFLNLLRHRRDDFNLERAMKLLELEEFSTELEGPMTFFIVSALAIDHPVTGTIRQVVVGDCRMDLAREINLDGGHVGGSSVVPIPGYFVCKGKKDSLLFCQVKRDGKIVGGGLAPLPKIKDGEANWVIALVSSQEKIASFPWERWRKEVIPFR